MCKPDADCYRRANANPLTSYKAEVGAELRHGKVEDQVSAFRYGESDVLESLTKPRQKLGEKTCNQSRKW